MKNNKWNIFMMFVSVCVLLSASYDFYQLVFNNQQLSTVTIGTWIFGSILLMLTTFTEHLEKVLLNK